jgi:DNA-binding transcriptional LysR family regulator
MADIGIIADTVNHEGLENFAFRDDRLVVIAAPGHALARAARTTRGARGRRGFTLAEIAEHELIGLSGSSALQQHIGRQAATAGQRLRYRLRLPGFESVCRMVASGAGIAIVPEAAALRHAETLGIRHFAVREAWALRKLLVAVHQLDNLPRHARELVAALRT